MRRINLTGRDIVFSINRWSVKDIESGKINYQNESRAYLIIKFELSNANEKELIVKSLKEAADVVGIHYSTLSKRLISAAGSNSAVEVNNNLIRRVKVFLPPEVTREFSPPPVK